MNTVTANSPPGAALPRAFGRSLRLQRPTLCPELRLWLLAEDVDLEAECRELHDGEPAPYWAFCWGSGQALARFVLDHPERVANRSVVDFGAGSGVAGIAAALAGARRVVAVDRDPNARAVAAANALENGVTLTPETRLPDDWDLLLASDVLYESPGRDIVMQAVDAHRCVLAGEPGRPGAFAYEQAALQRYAVRTLPDVDSPTRSAAIYRLCRHPGPCGIAGLSRARRENGLGAA